MKAEITSFTDEYYFLSNFYPHFVQFDGMTFASNEHAFQAAKTENRDERMHVRAARTSGVARKLGRKVTLRRDWDSRRIVVMRILLQAKFSDPELRDKLLATGTSKLIEGNDWGDTFWGVCRGKGENMLGKLLMELRQALQPDLIEPEE